MSEFLIELIDHKALRLRLRQVIIHYVNWQKIGLAQSAAFLVLMMTRSRSQNGRVHFALTKLK